MASNSINIALNGSKIAQERVAFVYVLLLLCSTGKVLKQC